MKKILFISILSFLYLFANVAKPYWIYEEKIPYRYYGIKGVFIHKKGENYTINLASNLAKQDLLKTLDKNINLTNNQKIKLMQSMQKKQYKSTNSINN